MPYIQPKPNFDKNSKHMMGTFVFSISILFFLFMITFIFCMIQSCTLSFQNISTHGTATDLVDENQTASPKTSANIPINIPNP